MSVCYRKAESAILRELEAFILELGTGLRWLERHETGTGEEAPLGLILCAGKSDEHVELLQLDRSGIRVAAYLTELPPKKLLEQKLHESACRAKAHLGGGTAP